MDRQRVVTAYTLAFGSLLLLGGRLADLLGRKVTFLTGLAGFAGVSAVGGAAPSTYGFLAAGVVLGVVFALRQTRAAHPLLPPRVVLEAPAWSPRPTCPPSC